MYIMFNGFSRPKLQFGCQGWSQVAGDGSRRSPEGGFVEFGTSELPSTTLCLCMAVSMASRLAFWFSCDHRTTPYVRNLRMSSGRISGQVKPSTTGIMLRWFCIAVTISYEPNTSCVVL